MEIEKQVPKESSLEKSAVDAEKGFLKKQEGKPGQKSGTGDKRVIHF